MNVQYFGEAGEAIGEVGEYFGEDGDIWAGAGKVIKQAKMLKGEYAYKLEARVLQVV